MVYNCDICGKAFGYLFSMKKHREKHAPFCSGNFQPSFSGEEHHLCILCNRLFSCYASLKRHQLTTHTENGPVFNCPYCPYNNPFSWQVKRHIYKRHGLEENYFCGGCKTFFRSDADRNRHMCSAPNNRFKQSNRANNDTNNNTVDEEATSTRNSSNADGLSNEEGGNYVVDDDSSSQMKNKDETITVRSGQNEEANNANNSETSSNTPCICVDCGTCLPSFEIMKKHQRAIHPERSHVPVAHDNGSTAVNLLRQSALLVKSTINNHKNDNRRRPVSGSSPQDGDLVIRSRSPVASRLDSAGPNSNGDSTSTSKLFRFRSPSHEKANNMHFNQNHPTLLIPSAVTSDNILTTVHKEVFSSYSPASSVVESSSSSPVILRKADDGNRQFPWECLFCGISFTDPAMWGLHSTMHDVADLRKCNFCGRQAKDKYDFWRHFIDHNKLPSASPASLPSSSVGSVEQVATTAIIDPIT